MNISFNISGKRFLVVLGGLVLQTILSQILAAIILGITIALGWGLMGFGACGTLLTCAKSNPVFYLLFALIFLKIFITTSISSAIVSLFIKLTRKEVIVLIITGTIIGLFLMYGDPGIYLKDYPLMIIQYILGILLFYKVRKLSETTPPINK